VRAALVWYFLSLPLPLSLSLSLSLSLPLSFSHPSVPATGAASRVRSAGDEPHGWYEYEPRAHGSAAQRVTCMHSPATRTTVAPVLSVGA
jgi:hypothetical protein